MRSLPHALNGLREARLLPLDGLEVRDSNAGQGRFTIRGHAAVFNRWSLDLGGFREKITNGAFQPVLDRDPDVHALWDHDTTLVLARTRGGSLELREDPVGLHMWARVAATSYARDLRTLMEDGLVDQASFAFTVARDEWRFVNEGEGPEDERVERTIHEIGDLFDVTVTAAGAYPTTNSEVVRSLRSRVAAEIELGNLPEHVIDRFPGADPGVAAERSGDTSRADSAGTDEALEPAPEEAELDERRRRALADLRNLTAGELALARERHTESSRRRYRLTSPREKE